MKKGEFPKRVYVQEFDGKLPPESKFVSDEMKSRKIPVFQYTAEDMLLFNRMTSIKPTDLIVGDFKCTRKAMKICSIEIPDPPDYPKCLEYLLNRKIFRTSLGKVDEYLLNKDGSSKKIFVKPSTHSKLFSGLILNPDWLSYLLEEHFVDLEIYCSEVVKFLSEYRVYVVNGEIKAVCHYATSSDVDKKIPLDMEVVKKAVKEFSEKGYEGKSLAGCGIDFGIIKKTSKDGKEKYMTTLIEVNDGISLGVYKGVSQKDYTDLLTSRWEQLILV